MNSSNRKHEISYVITHMQVPVNNKEFRNRKKLQENNKNNITPTYELIYTRGINIITITKLLIGLEPEISESIKKNILDMYKKDVFIIIIYNDNSTPIFITKMSMITFINYLTDPNTNDAKRRNPTDDISKIIRNKLLYRSKKIVYRIYDKKSKNLFRFNNVFYDIHHHPNVIVNHNLGNESTARTELERSIIGKYYLDGRRFDIPVDSNKMCECSLNTLLDSYGKQLPQCIILIGCRTLTRTNQRALRILVASNTSFTGTKLNRNRRPAVNFFSSGEQNSNAPFYRQPSEKLHQGQYSNNLNNNNNHNNNKTEFKREKLKIANIRKIINNIHYNNNNKLNNMHVQYMRNRNPN